MADLLFLRFLDEGLEWLVFDGHGHERLTGRGSLETFQEDVGANFEGQGVLVVPGEDVLMTSAIVPSKQYRQIVQAVPYAIEEQLAVDVEDCFFALGKRTGQGQISVCVVKQELMAAWVSQLSGLNILINAMVTETSLVSPINGTNIVIDNNRAHVRWQDSDGLTTAVQELPLVLSLIDDTSPIEITVNDEDLDLQVSEMQASGEEVSVTSSDQSAFYLLCCRYDGSQTNLLQAQFKVEEERSALQTVWRSVAILAGVTVLVHLLTLVGQGLYLARKADQYESATQALYKKTFPDDKNVRDIRRRWNSHLGSTGSTANAFMGLFAQSSKGLAKAGLTLTNINFNESRGDLILQVQGMRSEELVQYTQLLAGEGLTAEIGTISQEAGSVRGSIKIKAPGGAS